MSEFADDPTPADVGAAVLLRLAVGTAILAVFAVLLVAPDLVGKALGGLAP